MSIILNVLTLIIPKIVITEKFFGGIDKFYDYIPNQTFQNDSDLVSVSFMNGNDVEYFIKILTNNGLQYDGIDSKDFVVINSFFGNYWSVDWLDRDNNHCWLKGTLPTHTNPYKPVFKKHKILDEIDENCIWWNNLNNAWKNVLYHNYKCRGEKQSEKLHSLFYVGYKMQYIGEITTEDLQNMHNLELIRVDGMSCSELVDLTDLEPIKKFTKLKSLVFKRTTLTSLKGIENFPLLTFVEMDGKFSDLKYLTNLTERPKLNLHSPNIKSIEAIMDVDLEFLNINGGRISNIDSLYAYKSKYPNTNVVIFDPST